VGEGKKFLRVCNLTIDKSTSFEIVVKDNSAPKTPKLDSDTNDRFVPTIFIT
jgi:hypothetical protein